MKLCSFILLIGFSTATVASALQDLLDMPAVAAERALSSLTLDVARAGDRLVAVGEYGSILYSDDEGASWRQAQVPVQVTLTSVHFPAPRLGWAVGHDGVILHSSDAGVSWQRQLDGHKTGDLLVEGAQSREQELAILKASGDLPPDELSVLQDSAMMAMDDALREQEIGPNRPFLDVWFTDEQNGFAIGAFNYFFVTTDGGRTWTDGSARLPNPEFLHLYSISPIVGNVLLMVGEFGMVMRSLDAGNSWESLDLGYEGTLFSVSGAAGEAWVAGLRGNVFYSPDAGNSWQHVKQKTEASLLGSYIKGEGSASFVGLGGVQLDIDLSGALPSIKVEKASASTLAALTSVGGSGLVLVGQSGIARKGSDGKPLPTTYIENEQ